MTPSWAKRRRAERVQGMTLGQGLTGELERVAREGVEAYCLDVGLSSLKAAMEEEVTAYCGPRSRRLGEGRRYVRYGKAPGSVVVGARRVPILRPRVRTADGREVRLRIYDEARDGRFLKEAAMAALLSGTSQRRYGRAERAMAPAGRRVFGLSASSAGRRFIAATRRVAKAFRERPIEGTFLALFAYAVSFGGYLVAVAVGVRDDGEKMVLGIHQDTETRRSARSCSKAWSRVAYAGTDGGCWSSPTGERASRRQHGRCSARPWSFSDAARTAKGTLRTSCPRMSARVCAVSSGGRG